MRLVVVDDDFRRRIVADESSWTGTCSTNTTTRDTTNNSSTTVLSEIRYIIRQPVGDNLVGDNPVESCRHHFVLVCGGRTSKLLFDWVVLRLLTFHAFVLRRNFILNEFLHTITHLCVNMTWKWFTDNFLLQWGEANIIHSYYIHSSIFKKNYRNSAPLRKLNVSWHALF